MLQYAYCKRLYVKIESYAKSRKHPSTNEFICAREHIKLRVDRHVMQNVKEKTNWKMIATMRWLCACLCKWALKIVLDSSKILFYVNFNKNWRIFPFHSHLFFFWSLLLFFALVCIYFYSYPSEASIVHN